MFRKFNRAVETTKQFGNLFFNYPSSIKLNDGMDPRKVMDCIFRCNLRAGYTNKVFLYFFKLNCVGKECYILRSKPAEELVEYARTVADQKSTSLEFTSSSQLIWFCKRDILSMIPCDRFAAACASIDACITYEISTGLSGYLSESYDFVMDDQCHSPLPLHPAIPLPELALTNKEYQIGELLGANTITHILSLGKLVGYSVCLVLEL